MYENSYHNASLAHWMLNADKKKYIPSQIDIDVTNKCNQNCYYCNTADFRNKTPVQQHYTKYIELLEKLNNWRKHTPNSYGTLHTITFAGGGEPTLLKGYEKILEYAIDCGFLISLSTNATLLNKLYENINPNKLKKMNWIGIDIDAGNEKTYEIIRQSKTNNMFQLAIKHASELCKLNIPTDFKILASEYNTSEKEILDTFKIGKEVNIRMIYYRPVITNHACGPKRNKSLNGIFKISPRIVSYIKNASEKYNIPYKINLTKNIDRNYTKCHQMFQFPSFCVDGNIYVCCDNKGLEQFKIGRWLDNDFRNQWQDERHWEVYNNINTTFCEPCRPNINNIEIQNILDDHSKLGILNA